MFPAVTGTTGWLEHLPEVASGVEQSGSRTGLESELLGGRRCLSQARRARRASFCAIEPEYGAWAWEIHHDAKKDAPSGTLLHLVEAMEQSGYHGPLM